MTVPTDSKGHRTEAVVHENAASDRMDTLPWEELPDSLAEHIATARARPGDVAAQVAAAYACDREGHEAVAVQFYDAAWRLGLPADGRAELLIGYGSTLRNVGRAEEAERVLAAALREDPDNHAARCFYGLALHSAGKSASAVAELLDVALTLHEASPDLTTYRRALAEYRDELRRER
jgi:tetratricopeptide (TPR) repeat protein